MKKMMLAAIAVCMMSAGAWAAQIGKVDIVEANGDGTVKVRILKADQSLTGVLPLIGTAEGIKAMMAAALTAQAAGKDVAATYSGGGWVRIQVRL